MYRKLKFALFLSILVFAAACTGAAQPVVTPFLTDADISAQAADTSSQPVNGDGIPIVARVNGMGITQAQFERALLRNQQDNTAADPAALRASILDSLIEQLLIEQAAAAEQIVVSDLQVDTELQSFKAEAAGDAAWQQFLNQNLYTEAEFRESLRSNLIANAMLDHITENLPENVLQVHARHILVETEQQANDLLARLQNGEEFAVLAAANSRDMMTRDSGGDLGWFLDGELLEPALSQVAFAIEPGQIAGPVATRLGYHILQTLERAEMPLPEERRSGWVQLTFENWLQGLSYNAVIERYLT